MNAHPASRYAKMTAAEVLAAQAELLARWAAEDAERAARRAALLAPHVSER